MKLRFRWIVLALTMLALPVGCGGEEEETAGGGSQADFEKTFAPFDGFSYSTGDVPKKGQAQVSLSARAQGDLTVVGIGDVGDGKLLGRQGTGKVSLKGGFFLDGNIKVDAFGVKHSGDLPGLKD